jgi:hypothetical protein
MADKAKATAILFMSIAPSATSPRYRDSTAKLSVR